MSDRRNGRRGEAGAQAPSASIPGLRLTTVTFDGSLLSAPPAGRAMGGSPGSATRGVRPGPRSTTAGATTAVRGSTTAGAPKRSSATRPPSDAVHLDKGESETAFLGTLRTHYTRNGTAESFAPRFKAAPHKAYGARSGSPGSGAGPASGATRLQRQEQALWEEREEELVDAQDRRFAQLEDALAAREAKREAYLVHRLEASAADKLAEHRRRQEAAAHQRTLAAKHAQHLPSLRQAAAAASPVSPAAALQKLAGQPVFPASSALAAAVGQAAASIASLPGISTLQAGLEAGTALVPGVQGVARAGAPALGGGRATWQDKGRAAAAAHADAVYGEILAVKAGGASLLSPLDAAKAADEARAPRGATRRARLKAGSQDDATWDAEAEEAGLGFADTLAAAYHARQVAAGDSAPPSQPDSGRRSAGDFQGFAEGLPAGVAQAAVAEAVAATAIEGWQAEQEEQATQPVEDAEVSGIQEGAVEQAEAAAGADIEADADERAEAAEGEAFEAEAEGPVEAAEQASDLDDGASSTAAKQSGLLAAPGSSAGLLDELTFAPEQPATAGVTAEPEQAALVTEPPATDEAAAEPEQPALWPEPPATGEAAAEPEGSALEEQQDVPAGWSAEEQSVPQAGARTNELGGTAGGEAPQQQAPEADAGTDSSTQDSTASPAQGSTASPAQDNLVQDSTDSPVQDSPVEAERPALVEPPQEQEPPEAAEGQVAAVEQPAELGSGEEQPANWVLAQQELGPAGGSPAADAADVEKETAAPAEQHPHGDERPPSEEAGVGEEAQRTAAEGPAPLAEVDAVEVGPAAQHDSTGTVAEAMPAEAAPVDAVPEQEAASQDEAEEKSEPVCAAALAVEEAPVCAAALAEGQLAEATALPEEPVQGLQCQATDSGTEQHTEEKQLAAATEEAGVPATAAAEVVLDGMQGMLDVEAQGLAGRDEGVADEGVPADVLLAVEEEAGGGAAAAGGQLQPAEEVAATPAAEACVCNAQQDVLPTPASPGDAMAPVEAGDVAELVADCGAAELSEPGLPGVALLEACQPAVGGAAAELPIPCANEPASGGNGAASAEGMAAVPAGGEQGGRGGRESLDQEAVSAGALQLTADSCDDVGVSQAVAGEAELAAACAAQRCVSEGAEDVGEQLTEGRASQ